jgi:release factor glutamine methyltransferase
LKDFLELGRLVLKPKLSADRAHAAPYAVSVTVLEVIRRSSEFLAKRGVDSPRLQAELLLAHALGLPRMKLYLSFDRELTEPELSAARGLVKRRGEREPLQHILGSTSFCGLEIAVTRDVLVPRPETELLAVRAVKFLLSRGAAATVLDFGTGSGCLAIAIAAQAPTAELHATDLSEAALEVARRNVDRHPLSGRIHFHHGDGFGALPDGLRFDLIVSNPPYIASEEIASLQPEVRDHDPRLALDGGADGLDFYRRLSSQAAARLNSGGRIMVELGDGQDTAVHGLFEAEHWQVEGVENDDTGRARILIACGNS